MQKRLSPGATMVGVNGDFYADSGRPSGVLMRDNVVESPPYGDRSSTGVTPEGGLDVRRVEFFGTWRGLGQRRTLNDLNQSPGRERDLALHAHLRPDDSCPAGRDRGRDLRRSRRRRRTPTSPGRSSRSRPAAARRSRRDGAVLVARGTAGSGCVEESPVGTLLTLRLIFRPEWTGVANAVGGGPGARAQRRARLPRAGGVHLEPARAAESAHRRRPARRRPGADGRHRRPPPRLQRRDDELRARADDGPARRRHRLRLRRRRLVLARLRRQAAQPARPTAAASGRSRTRSSSCTTASTRRRRRPSISPNGDGFAEQQRELTYKVVRPSNVTATLVAPGGAVAFTETLEQQPGTYPGRVPAGLGRSDAGAAPPGEGRWRLEVDGDRRPRPRLDDDADLHRQQHARLRAALAPPPRRPRPRQADRSRPA